MLGSGLECAPDSGQVVGWELTGAPGFPKDGSMAKHHTYSIEFKRQVCDGYVGRINVGSISTRPQHISFDIGV